MANTVSRNNGVLPNSFATQDTEKHATMDMTGYNTLRITMHTLINIQR